jgi:hypothetical protein
MVVLPLQTPVASHGMEKEDPALARHVLVHGSSARKRDLSDDGEDVNRPSKQVRVTIPESLQDYISESGVEIGAATWL